MPYRNPKLLELAKKCPHCMQCGKYNLGHEEGTGEVLMPCHSNAQMHGKGRGEKAHDLVAYLCKECHDELDGRTNPGLIELTRKDKELRFYDAYFRSQLWLYESGNVHVSSGCKCGEAA